MTRQSTVGPIPTIQEAFYERLPTNVPGIGFFGLVDPLPIPIKFAWFF
jgi:hypothetical protein